tara:strand:- start:1350 stop:1754 length:405 start_codon:yes stop_codon:yes gene_type:complete
VVVEKSYVEYTHPRQISLWLVQFELETILKIIELSCCPFGDDRADIYGDALALDGLGMVYEVNLHFGVTKQEAEAVMSLAGPGRIVMAKGCYSYIPGAGGGITLHNPEFSAIDSDASQSDLNYVFMKNRWIEKN